MASKTLRERYPASPPIVHVDTAVTTEPKTIADLVQDTGCTKREVQSALADLLCMRLIEHDPEEGTYWSGCAGDE